MAKKIACEVCEKKFVAVTILKHISHSPRCKEKYSEEALNKLKEQSKVKSYQHKLKWERNNLEKRKEINAKYYQKKER